MMFGRLGVLNAFSIYNIFNLTMGFLRCNPIVNGGASVALRDATGKVVM